MNILERISECIIDGQIDEIKDLTKEALAEGISPKQILDKGLLSGMNVVGELFKDGELFVPEVLIAAKTMDYGMEELKPYLQEGDITKIAKCLFATVKGDLHDIGKKLVKMMMEGAGYEIIDLGVDVSPEKICEAVKEHNPNIIGMSAMLTTTMASMKDTVELLEKENILNSVKVMIGGAPVNKNFAERIGANYAGDASSAVELANKLMNV
jgi:5-methyltetrahydrofolate--homocysteine methyltransferase